MTEPVFACPRCGMLVLRRYSVEHDGFHAEQALMSAHVENLIERVHELEENPVPGPPGPAGPPAGRPSWAIRDDDFGPHDPDPF